MRWYHITNYYQGKEFEAKPSIPFYLRTGEDRRTPRICVTANWRHSLRSIILIKRCMEFFVYSTEVKPINPPKTREKLLNEKKIRKNCNDYKLLEDGFVNKEHWYIKPIKMAFEGVVKIPKKEYLGMLIGFGFCNDPDLNKMKLKPYKELSIEEYFKRR